MIAVWRNDDAAAADDDDDDDGIVMHGLTSQLVIAHWQFTQYSAVAYSPPGCLPGHLNRSYNLHVKNSGLYLTGGSAGFNPRKR